MRTSYDVLPLSFRLIIFDTGLSVKESLNILIQNGKSMLSPAIVPLSRWGCDDLLRSWNVLEEGNKLTVKHCWIPTGIVSAPLWDSKASKFAGLLTTSDYINVIQYYFQNPAALDQIDQFRLDSLRGEHRHRPRSLFLRRWDSLSRKTWALILLRGK